MKTWTWGEDANPIPSVWCLLTIISWYWEFCDDEYFTFNLQTNFPECYIVFYTEPQEIIYKSSSQRALPLNTTLSWRSYILRVLLSRPPFPTILISSPNSRPDIVYPHSLGTIFPSYFTKSYFFLSSGFHVSLSKQFFQGYSVLGWMRKCIRKIQFFM